MTVAHEHTHYATPTQWADDWLTPTEQRALRALEAMPASYAPQCAQTSLSEAYSARQRRIRARRLQAFARTVTFLTLGALFVVASGYLIQLVSIAFGH